MSDEYKDIIYLPHHVSSKRPQMPMLDRAAQFSPFAALTGYDDAIHETGPSGSTQCTAYTDAKKSGGAYVTKDGNLKKIDGFERWMMLTDGTKIPLDDVADIESELFRDLF